MTTTTLRVARLGNGAALHLVDDHGILCNRWGTVNGVWKAPKLIEGAEASCKRCLKLAGDCRQLATEQPCDGDPHFCPNGGTDCSGCSL